MVKTALSTEKKVNKTCLNKGLIKVDVFGFGESFIIFTEMVRGPGNMSKLEGHRELVLVPSRSKSSK